MGMISLVRMEVPSIQLEYTFYGLKRSFPLTKSPIDPAVSENLTTNRQTHILLRYRIYRLICDTFRCLVHLDCPLTKKSQDGITFKLLLTVFSFSSGFSPKVKHNMSTVVVCTGFLLRLTHFQILHEIKCPLDKIYMIKY